MNGKRICSLNHHSRILVSPLFFSGRATTTTPLSTRSRADKSPQIWSEEDNERLPVSLPVGTETASASVPTALGNFESPSTLDDVIASLFKSLNDMSDSTFDANKVLGDLLCSSPALSSTSSTAASDCQNLPTKDDMEDVNDWLFDYLLKGGQLPSSKSWFK